MGLGVKDLAPKVQKFKGSYGKLRYHYKDYNQ